MKVLKWRYKTGTNPLLDLIASEQFFDQDDLAEAAGCSIRTIENRIKELKKGGLLEIVRTREKEIYYLMGEDVGKKYNSFEVQEIWSFRFDPDNYVDPDQEDSGQDEISRYASYPVTKKSKPLVVSPEDHKEITEMKFKKL